MPPPRNVSSPPLLGIAAPSPQASRSITPSREEPSRDDFARVAREIHFGQFLITFSATITRREKHRPPQKIGDPDSSAQGLPTTGRTRKVYRQISTSRAFPPGGPPWGRLPKKAIPHIAIGRNGLGWMPGEEWAPTSTKTAGVHGPRVPLFTDRDKT